EILNLRGIQNTILDSNIELPKRVDLIISNHAFEHFADLDNVMRGVTRILKDRGCIFTFVPTYYKNRSNMSLLWMNSSHYSMFTDNTLNKLFGKYGLKEITHTY